MNGPLMTPMAWVWLAAMIVFAILEAVTPGLVSVWFALGALAGLAAALLGAQVWLQFVLFLAVSLLALLLTRPLARKLNKKRCATNADRSVGKTAVVTEAIDNLAGTGAVRLDGMDWTARSLSGSGFPVGARVIVREIQGVKLMVDAAEETL